VQALQDRFNLPAPWWSAGNSSKISTRAIMYQPIARPEWGERPSQDLTSAAAGFHPSHDRQPLFSSRVVFLDQRDWWATSRKSPYRQSGPHTLSGMGSPYKSPSSHIWLDRSVMPETALARGVVCLKLLAQGLSRFRVTLLVVSSYRGNSSLPGDLIDVYIPPAGRCGYYHLADEDVYVILQVAPIDCISTL